MGADFGARGLGEKPSPLPRGSCGVVWTRPAGTGTPENRGHVALMPGCGRWEGGGKRNRDRLRRPRNQ